MDDNYMSSSSSEPTEHDSSSECNFDISSDSDESSDKCIHKVHINYKIIFECCGLMFSCEKCHDGFFKSSSGKHPDPTDYKRIMCVKCDTPQKISGSCINCYTQFAPYYCDICKIFDESELNYHCLKCKMCVRGNKRLYRHCDKCNCCMESLIFKNHKCIQNKLNRNCAICLDPLANGEKVLSMMCGHALHNICYESLIKSSYKCPECFKTIKSMKLEFAKLDYQINCVPTCDPKIIKIKCNDCQQQSLAKFHHLGTKCLLCESYNTYENNN